MFFVLLCLILFVFPDQCFGGHFFPTAWYVFLFLHEIGWRGTSLIVRVVLLAMTVKHHPRHHWRSSINEVTYSCQHPSRRAVYVNEYERRKESTCR